MFFVGKMKDCILIIYEKQNYVSLTATGEKLLTFIVQYFSVYRK
jgi:Mn-dependent DtxR family transcriptional regulator